MLDGVLRSTVLAAARSTRVQRLVTGAPVSRELVRRYVGGPDTTSAVATTRGLQDDGLTVTLDHLGEDTTDLGQAKAVVAAYLELLEALHEAGLTGDAPGADTVADGVPRPRRAEVSVKCSAVGQALPGDGEAIALEHAREICAAAQRVGASVTLDMEDHTTTDSTLAILRSLRTDFPDTGAVLQAYLHRTEQDCRDLSGTGSRVRLCKGAYKEPESVAFQRKADVDRSYARCIKALLDGRGYPMFATHDPRLVDVAVERAAASGRAPQDYELQMLYGIRPDEQKRLAAAGHTFRVYVPYGAEWYGYLMRRLAERPANLTFFARSLLSKG